jgi:hypothetical protein
MAAVHAPGDGAGVEELGRGLGVYVDDGRVSSDN